MPRIRKDDMVEVIAGNDSGKRGRVLKVIPDRNRVVVQGINLRWKHLRKSQQSPQGGRVRREASLNISNVMVYDEEAGVRTRVGFKYVDGKKLRIGTKTGRELSSGGPAKAAAEPEKAAKPKDAKAKKGEE